MPFFKKGRLNLHQKDQWKNYVSDLVTPEEICDKFQADKEIFKVHRVYPFRINRYFFSLIKEKNDPLWLQAIPDEKELCKSNGSEDPFLEDNILSPVPNLIHRYKNRVILLVSDKCAVYCRHCMRKRRVGLHEETFFDNFSDILNYLESHDEIDDIILSGGDPLLVSDEKIEFILAGLRKIKKDSILRIHTRTFSTLPQRITENLCKIIKKYEPVYINTHFNHSMEITGETKKASFKACDYGIPLGCQSVFLKGVNDNFKALSDLFTNLLKIKIKPYYLHHPDPIKGTDHLRPDIEKGIKIMKMLRGQISGLAVPYYMIDLPDGGGKVPLLPEYIRGKGADYIEVENFKGKLYRYPL
ncbi:MAG: KamA family radical SAM protein [Desulfobacteraceae bacterium]|nr:KamA family radical SAM protein [Desulfobacteraceae bacterium]MCB9494252.1 KamA family radical SAM protein [Desulfobacteraceae bacterium]